jgi:hypothetical protein
MNSNELYKRAAINKLRFTFRGSISTEDLFSLDLKNLNKIAQSVHAELSKEENVSFLEEETNPADTTNRLRLEILKDVIKTKEANAKKATQAAATRSHNEKIRSLIAEKKDEELKNLSLEELEKKLETQEV